MNVKTSLRGHSARGASMMRAMAAAMVAALLLAACASMGRPEGGPRDMDPPVFVRSNPMPGELNVTSNKISLWFDENLKLDDAANKVIVSPAQKEQPIVSANAKRVRVELRDTLIPDATYTIDFGDAIRDLNEDNPLDGFALAFATGSVIDSLSISGMVVEARTLEPAQGMLVGVHRDPMPDTALTRMPFERVTRTNQLGQFTLRNLPHGSFRVFAVNDVNRDNRWDRSEDVAFYPLAITPTAEVVTEADTIAPDSIIIRHATHFGPSDLLLEWFNEDYRRPYLSKHERPERRRLEVLFGAPADSMPRFSLLSPADSSFISRLEAPRLRLTSTPGRDSVTAWLVDSALIMADTLCLAIDYRGADSLERPVWQTDTLRFLWREPKKSKEQQRVEEARAKRAEEAEKALAEGDTVTADSLRRIDMIKPPMLDLSYRGSSAVDVNVPLVFETSTPIASVDSLAGVRLEMSVDTLWVPVKVPGHISLTDTLMRKSLTYAYPWAPGRKYRLQIDTLAVADIFGLGNAPLSTEFTVKELEEYSSLIFNVQGLEPGEQAIVELLASGENTVKTAVVDSITHTAELSYLAPGQYYARMFVDRNANGAWDRGRLSPPPPADTALTPADSFIPLMPEPVSYYPKKINLKKNWDVELTWDINATPIEQQKPEDIKKNKPKRSKWDTDKPGNNSDEEEEYDEFGNPFGDDRYYDDGRGGFGAPAYGRNPFDKRGNARY